MDERARDIQYLEAIFNQSADGLMICDAQGRILKMNRRAEKLNGIRAADVLGRDVRSLVKEGQLDRSATQEVLETRRQVSVVQTTPRSGYTLLVTGTPVFDADNALAFVVVNERDISLIENMKRELVQTRQESEKIRHELTGLSLLELKENDIVARSAAMKQTVGLALRLAGIDASHILIQGESGTGKGLLAKLIHKHSSRREKTFIQINCAALPENLLEAELFGYEKGAFTGASETGKPGLFELAAGGTLFLDEIGELPLRVQAKLLKYLDDHQVMPIGATQGKKVDCSIIAATNRDLKKRIDGRLFRLDLLHRLNTFPLTIPPLRERPEDILELVTICLKRYNREYRRRTHMGYRAFEALKRYSFPGNVRELINIVKQAVVMSDRKSLDDYILRVIRPKAETADVATGDAAPAAPSRRLPDCLMRVEREMLEAAVKRCSTTREAAKYLGISQPTVVRKLKKHGLDMKTTP